MNDSGAHAQADCVFCRIVNGDEPATELWAGDWATVIAPLNPVVPGHVLAIPHDHTEDFTGREVAVYQALRAAAEYARQTGGDYNLITSKGAAATQTVMHLHFHLVPRRANDGLALPWSRGGQL